MLSRRLNLFLFSAAGLAATLPEVAFSQAVVVAFPRVTGPKPAGRGPTAQGVIAAFQDARIDVLRGPPLRAAAEELGSSVYSLEVAQVADCNYLSVVRISGRVGSFRAKGQVFRVSDGKSVLILEQEYRNRAGATAAGRSIGTRMAEAILRDVQFAQNQASAPVGDALVFEEEEFEPDETFEPVEEETVVRDREEPVFTEEPMDPDVRRFEEERTEMVQRSPSSRSMEQRLFQFSLSAGSRVSSGYKVTSGGVESSLSYTLDPVANINAFAGVYLPFGLTGDVDFGFSPASFNIQNVNQVQNANPGAQLLDLSANVGWRFNLLSLGRTSKLIFQPMVSYDLGSTLVDVQNNSPVNQFTTMSIGGGVRVLLDLPARWAFDLEGKGGAIIAYDEAPLATGINGSGVRVSGRLRGRYWLLGNIGVQLAARYELRSVSVEGPADAARSAFSNIALNNSTIDMDAFDVVLGVVLAL